MKEIETSGGRITLDDEDYEKIMNLGVPKIYYLINHTKIDHADGPYSLYVFPKDTTSTGKLFFLFGVSRGKKITYNDKNMLNIQRNNISIVERI